MTKESKKKTKKVVCCGLSAVSLLLLALGGFGLFIAFLIVKALIAIPEACCISCGESIQDQMIETFYFLIKILQYLVEWLK